MIPSRMIVVARSRIATQPLLRLVHLDPYSHPLAAGWPAAAVGLNSGAYNAFRTSASSASSRALGETFATLLCCPAGWVDQRLSHDGSGRDRLLRLSTWAGATTPCANAATTNTAAAAVATVNATKKFISPPPNLTFDPRSKLSPNRQNQQQQQPQPPSLVGQEARRSSPRRFYQGRGGRGRQQQEQERGRKSSMGAQGTAAPTLVSEIRLDEEGDSRGDDDDNDDGTTVDIPSTVAASGLQDEIPLPDRLHANIYTLLSSDQSSPVGTIWLSPQVFGLEPVRVDLLKRCVDYYRAKKRGWRKAKTKTISEVRGSGKKRRPQKGTGQARMGHRRPPHHRGGAKAHGPKNTVNYGNTKLNVKVRRLALRHALSQKLREGNLILYNQLYDLPTHKSNNLYKLLRSQWDIGGLDGRSALILDHYYPPRQPLSMDKNSGGDDVSTDQHNDNENESVNETSTPGTVPNHTTTSRVGQRSSSSSISSLQEGGRPLSMRGLPVNFWAASRNLVKVAAGNTHQASVYEILRHEKLVLTLAALEELEARLSD